MTALDHTLSALPLSEQLQKLVKNAELIHSDGFQKYKEKLSGKLLWLRPSVNEISAISCCDDTPQLGFSNISDCNLEKKMETALLPPKRDTPEKRLQSWLIRQALKSGGRLEPLHEVLGGRYWFVSDEIALKTASVKVVADLLLVAVNSKGLARLVNVELKSKRLMETFRQVVCFRKVLEDPGLQEGWKRFAEVMTGENFQWHPSQETYGVVIWPARNDQTKAQANAKREDYARVDAIGYKLNEQTKEYSFQFERARLKKGDVLDEWQDQDGQWWRMTVESDTEDGFKGLTTRIDAPNPETPRPAPQGAMRR